MCIFLDGSDTGIFWEAVCRLNAPEEGDSIRTGRGIIVGAPRNVWASLYVSSQ